MGQNMAFSFIYSSRCIRTPHVHAYSIRKERNLHASQRRNHNIRHHPRRLPTRLPTLHPPKPLQQSNHRIPHLRKREVLTQTNPGPTIKWDIIPRLGEPVLPSFRAEGICWGGVTGWVEIRAPLHYEGGVGDFGALGDADGGVAVWTAAVGEGCVVQGYPDVDGDGGVDAQDLVDAGLCRSHGC